MSNSDRSRFATAPEWLWLSLVTALLSTALPAQAQSPQAQSSSTIDFTRQIRPVLSENCFTCHGPDDKKRKAGLRLDLKSEAFKKLKSDSYAIVPGDTNRSELVRRIARSDPDDQMPPAKSGKQLTPAQIDLLTRWVAQGAQYQDHWAYIKPEHLPVPAVKLKTWPRNPIDYFVLAKLEEEGLKPSPEAMKQTLVRRLSLDMTGLPPSIEEVERFIRDNRADAYEQLVERLLSSPRYGERWARPWLDEARYADSNGYEADYKRSIWPYRDWVIQAFNRDLPFDEFTIEQIAGDLLPNPSRDQKVATGFHRNTLVNTEGGTDDEEFRVAAIIDRVNTTFGVWMGTTIGCAQCHSHKYDPFTQREYYELFSFFNQTKDKGRSNEPELELPTDEQARQREKIQAQLKPLEKILDTQTPELDQIEALWEEDLRAARESIQAGWVPLDPESASASADVNLRVLDDRSILSSGPLADTSVYELTARTALKNVSAIRLEAIADDQLPQHSSGRSEDGDFVLTEFTVQAFPARSLHAPSPAPPVLGPWKSLGPFHASTVREAFSRAFISEKKVDLNQEFDEGKLRWSERADFADGTVHALEGENSATYLYRTITVSEPLPLMVSLGSDDGLQVWLNGNKVLSKEVERAVAPDQESVELQLAKGENQLLLKINNGSGQSGFYFAVSEDQSGAGRVAFETAYADFSMEKYDVKDAIDGKPKTGWSIAAFEPSNRADHEAVFVPKTPLHFEDGARLVFKLKQESDRSQHLLGRFRLSVSTADRQAHLDWASVPSSVRTVLSKPLEDRAPAQQQEVENHYRSIDSRLDKTRSEIAELRKQLPKDIPSTLVMERADAGRKTHILIRGSHLNKGDEVEPGTPQVLHAWPADQPKNRLGFARWLVDPSNPLVGRVTMNRIWAQYFGRGLVETSQDFGAQGELPTHPQLLDWLATEFIREGWSLKAMHRLIVTSATYRQSSAVPEELQEADPFNRWLGRGPRFRMEAEMLRDSALAVAGLLSEKVGGPSVFPFQPDGVWNSPYNGDRWTMSKTGDQFRRGLYTFWRRTAPYASFAAFDAPSREVMCERRTRSNTPVQALVTLNDPAFFAAANGLARRIVQEGGSAPEQRLGFAFECCLSRLPDPSETRPLLKLYAASVARFRQQPGQARALLSIGAGGKEDESTLADLAAWSVIANVLLNLDETLTKG